MSRAVAAVAAGQTDHVSRRVDVGIAELVREAIDRCLETRDLTLADVDALVLGNMEMFEGINLVEHWLADALGVAGKPLWKLNTGGTVGSSTAVAAYYLIAGGYHRRVLCVGFEKQSEGSTQSAITTVGDPVWERAVMAGAIGNFAAMTSVYVNESGVTPEQAAKVAVKARRNACRNPHAHLKLPDITVEERARLGHAGLPGAQARHVPELGRRLRGAVRGRRGRRRARAARPAWVHAAVTAHDQQYMGDSPKRLAEMRSLIAARDEGLPAGRHRRPGARPRRRRDLRAGHLRRARDVRVPRLLREGRRRRASSTRASPELDGALPVNPSGGVLSTNPVGRDRADPRRRGRRSR